MKINKDCNKIYDGVLLQSYTLVVTNVIIFNVVKLIVEKLIIPPILNYFFPPQTKTIQKELTRDDVEINPLGERSLQVEENSDVNKSNRKVPKSAVIFLYLQGICALFALIVACMNHYEGNFWVRYECFYGFLLNSPFFTFFISATIFAYKYDDLEEAKPLGEIFAHFYHFCIYVVAIAFFPPCFTHFLPAAILYGYFLIAGVVVMWGLNKILSKSDFYDYFAVSESEVTNLLKLEITLRLVVILFFQTYFNYMYLFYQYRSPSWGEYVGVITEEYRLRTQTYCAFESWDADLRSLLVFFSWM
jgi:hypothetical protein